MITAARNTPPCSGRPLFQTGKRCRKATGRVPENDGAVAFITLCFLAFFATIASLSFPLLSMKRKKDCRCAYFYALRQILDKQIAPCGDCRIIASLREGWTTKWWKEPAGVKENMLQCTVQLSVCHFRSSSMLSSSTASRSPFPAGEGIL